MEPQLAFTLNQRRQQPSQRPPMMQGQPRVPARNPYVALWSGLQVKLSPTYGTASILSSVSPFFSDDSTTSAVRSGGLHGKLQCHSCWAIVLVLYDVLILDRYLIRHDWYKGKKVEYNHLRVGAKSAGFC